MRLSQLEISGFKSFSDRSHLSFDRGVTAIVGPNGCGKSNVADAITWVLGEQSAKSLRGDRMEDVIFNGSDARKPTGAAEVRLRLSDVLSAANVDLAVAGNGDSVLDDDRPTIARTVEVTRRLYRSGESEYLIDGEICRLRDVHEFLMDTGLGAKAYAIIEQGKIGMILSSRPTDRRQLIEEAAGITKYKARRRAAELKLEAAQAQFDPAGRHHLRAREAVWVAETPVGQSTPLQAASGRAAALGKDPVCPAISGIGRENRIAARRVSKTAQYARIGGAAAVSTAEADFSRVRISLVEAEANATSAREAVHCVRARHQPPAAADRVQPSADRGIRQPSRGGTRRGHCARREAGARAARSPRAHGSSRRKRREDQRTRGDSNCERIEKEYSDEHLRIEGLEADVEAARSEVFSALNVATTLRHAIQHAEEAAQRVAEELAKLAVEESEVRMERERLEGDRAGHSRRASSRHGGCRGIAARADGARDRIGHRPNRA